MAVSTIDPAGLNIGQIGGRRNLIQNGAFQIWQRGTSFTPPTSAVRVVDRWQQYQGGGGVLYYERSTDAPTGFGDSLKVTVNTADTSIAASDFYYIRQTIEGYNIIPLALGTSDAVTFTLSFYVKSSLTGTFCGSYTGGSGSARTYVFEYTINSANTWERKSVTVVGDTSGTWTTNNDAGMRLNFDFGMGSNFDTTANSWQNGSYYCTSGAVKLVGTASATWYLTGVQLEVGNTATDFEHISYGEQLNVCMRYFEKTSRSFFSQLAVVSAAGTNREAPIQWLVRKRAAPSVTFDKTSVVYYLFSIATGDTPSAINAYGISVDGCLSQGTGMTSRTKGDTCAFDYVKYEADADL